MPAPKLPIGPTKYSWTMTADRRVKCYKSQAGGQTITSLWVLGELTPFHDAELAQATKEINAILTRVEASNKEPELTLSFIRFQNRHFLVWARYGAVGPHDDEATIRKTLRVKGT